MGLKVKTISSWFILSAVVVMLIFAVTASLLVSNKTYAEGELKIDQINHNAYYKVVYQNLKKCYAEMKSPLTESSTNTWASFDSGTFFSDVALEDSFLKFPYNTVASKDQASCPGMIMGWHTNWFINIFTGNGSYDGLLELNQNASVPDGSWNSNVDNYSTFLKNIGYTENSDNSALANAKCFYVSMEITEDFYDMYWGPVAGTKFETQDFCVNLSGNSDIVNHGSTFYLKGKNDYFGEEYDEGHLDDDVNVAYVFFKQGDLVPKYYVGLRTGDTVLDATLDYYFLNYKYYNSTVGEYQRDALTYISPDTVSTKKNAVDNDYCWGLGYYKCGYEDKGFLYTTWYWGTLMPQNGLISFNDFKTKLTKVIAQTQSDGAYWFDNVRSVEYKPTTNTYTKSNDSSKFIDYFLLNTDNYDDGKFNEAEKYMLYYTYLKDYYDVSIRADAVDGGVKVSWLNDDNKTFSDVYVYNPKQNSSELQYILDNSDKWDGSSTADWYNIALLLAEINTEDAFEGAETVDSVIDPDLGEQEDPVSGGTSEPTCANSGGAMSLGWIVCPLLNWMGNAATSIYDDFVEPQLEVKAGLFDENMSATKNAWEVFRNIANICFVILLLVVIFSQLTGVGIDNYGIKRILPKLIVTAILINLSYYICLIAVDISNILGNGLQALFNGLQSGTVEINLGPNGGGWGGNTSQEVASTTITGVAILALLVTMVGSIWANPAILLSLLVGALGVVIAIFFLFILLAARQAAIVVLVVLSPIAFACYMLPNTKKIFDKWTQMSKGLLLVYPIAGLLVGGGNFVSKLLLSTGIAADGFFSALTAMIVGIIPIFFIPTVLKGSFAAVGNLGAKISGFGDRFRGRADKGIRNSERYKDTSARWRAGQNKNGDMTRIGKLRARSAESKFAKGRIGGLLGLSGVSRSQARGIAEVEKRRGEDEAASASLIGAMSKEGIAKAGSENAYYESKFLAAAASGNVSEMNAAIEAARKSNMKPKDIAKMVRNAQNNGNFKFKDGATRSAWYRDLSRRYGNDFLATDFELSSFAQTGGTGNSGVLGNYGDYVKPGGIGIDDIKPEDVGKLSGDSLAGLAKSGLIDQSLAERSILSNPNLSADKKIMLSAIASGAADSTTITSVKDFKDDAEQLMKNHASTAGLKTMTAKAVTQAMVDAWASVTPESVNVVQNFQGGGPGQVKPVDVDIKH